MSPVPNAVLLFCIQGVFLSYGALGIAWLALWLPLVPERTPEGLVAEVAESLAGGRDSQGLQDSQTRDPSPLSSSTTRLAVATATAGTTTATAVGAVNGGSPSSPALGDFLERGDSSSAAVGTSALTVSTAAAATAGGARAAAATDAVQVNGVRTSTGENSSDRRRNLLSVQTVAVEKGAARGAVPYGGGATPVTGQPPRGENEASDGSPARGVAVGGGGGIGRVLGGFRGVPWKEYATNGQIWSIASAHMSHNWGLYVMLAWLPTYFSQVRCFGSLLLYRAVAVGVGVLARARVWGLCCSSRARVKTKSAIRWLV